MKHYHGPRHSLIISNLSLTLSISVFHTHIHHTSTHRESLSQKHICMYSDNFKEKYQYHIIQTTPLQLILQSCIQEPTKVNIHKSENILEVLVSKMFHYETFVCTFLASYFYCASTGTCLRALMFKKVFVFLILPVLQHLFSPSVWNQSPVCSDWLAGRLCCDWSTA